MHDHEERLTQWRQELADQIGANADVLDELESHLREQTDQLIRQGKTPEEAVEMALAAMGAPERIAAEFAKNGQAWWPIRAVLAAAICTALAGAAFVAYRSLHGRADWLLALHVATIMAGYLFTYGVGTLSLCYAGRRMFRDLTLGQQTSWLGGMMVLTVGAFLLTSTGAALGAVWASEHLGRYWDWDIRETGAVITLSWQAILLFSIWRFATSKRWLIAWGLLGNVTITFAWFVATSLASNVQSHAALVALAIVAALTGLAMIGGVARSGWLRRRKLAS
jgi:hypothetical protein